MDPEVNLGALISKKHQELVLGYIDKGIQEGATLLTGGKALSPASAPNGYFVEPTVFVDCKDDMTIVKEEIFGPVMSVLVFDDEETLFSVQRYAPVWPQACLRKIFSVHTA